MGRRRGIVIGALALATAVARFGAAPANPAALIISAALYGAAAMTIGALFVVWSATFFPTRPGLGLTRSY